MLSPSLVLIYSPRPTSFFDVLDQHPFAASYHSLSTPATVVISQCGRNHCFISTCQLIIFGTRGYCSCLHVFSCIGNEVFVAESVLTLPWHFWLWEVKGRSEPKEKIWSLTQACHLVLYATPLWARHCWSGTRWMLAEYFEGKFQCCYTYTCAVESHFVEREVGWGGQELGRVTDCNGLLHLINR